MQTEEQKDAIKRFELTEEQKGLIKKFEELAAQLGGSERKAGEVCGVGSSIVSQLRSETYKGVVSKQFGILKAYFETKEKAAKTYSEVEYAPTTISEVVYKTLESIKIKGGLAIITGDAGIGKTKALEKYSRDNPLNSVMITINPCKRSTKEVLKLLAAEMGVPISQNRGDLWSSIAAKLHDGMIIAVDEAQILPYDSIETLRSFPDYFAKHKQTVGVALVGNDGIREKIEGRSRDQYDQVNNRAWQRPELHTTDVQRTDIEMLLPILNGKEQEITLLHKIAQTTQGIRGAMLLFSNAYDEGNYDFDGLVKMAKIMRINLKGIEKVVRRK